MVNISSFLAFIVNPNVIDNKCPSHKTFIFHFFFLEQNLTNAIDVYSVRSQEINWVCKEAIRHVYAKNPGFSLASWGDMYKLWTFTRLTGGSCVSISAKLLNRMALTLWCACVWNYFPFWVGFSQSVFFSNLSKCYNHSAINDCIVFFGHVLGIPRCPVLLWKKHTFQIPYRSHFGADTLNDSINIMLLDWWGNNFNLTSFTRVYQGESRKLESILLFTLYFFYYRGCGTS